MKVRYTPRAIGDLASIKTYLEERSPRGSRNVAAAIRGVVNMLCLFPRVGTLTERNIRRLVEPRSRYLIYYRVMPEHDAIEVLSIRHPAQSPQEF